MQSSILSTCLALQMKTGWENEGPKGERHTVGMCLPVMSVGPASVSAVIMPTKQWQAMTEVERIRGNSKRNTSNCVVRA